MRSSEMGQHPEQLEPEKMMSQERERLGGVLEKMGKNAKARIAGVVFMAITSSIFAGAYHEAMAAEKRQGVKTEHVEKEKIPSEFLVQKEGFSFVVKFSENARRIMEEGSVRFDEKTGDFALGNESKPMPPGQESSTGSGIVVLKQEMVGKISTQRVEVGGETLTLPGGLPKTQLKINIYNSDGSTEQFTLVDGKIVNYGK